MNETKLPQLILGSIISWGFTGLSWMVLHGPQIATGFAILASILTGRAAIYAARASAEDRKLKRAQREFIEEVNRNSSL